MAWRQIHRWLGLMAGALALVIGITGTVLALDPVIAAWLARPAAADLPVATLVERVSATVPGAEEIRRLPSSDIVVYGFDNGQAVASRVDPNNGRVLGEYQASPLMRWFRNLHRSFLLGDAGRITAAVVALSMLLLAISGLVLLQRRQGGWRKVFSRARGTGLQRLHVVTGQVLVAVLGLSSVTALFMSAVTFGLIDVEHAVEPSVVSTAPATIPTPAAAAPLQLLQDTRVAELRKVNFPAADDPEDTWRITTDRGEGWVDRYSGQTLAWQPATTAQRLQDWAMVLHTGESAWAWALVLGLGALSIPLFWVTGLLLWLQARRLVPRIGDNSALPQADTLIFVASENGSTWGFAEALHTALVGAGHKMHTSGLENFRAGATAQQIFVLAATYGDGQAPAHAARALERIAQTPATAARVAVLAFGDRAFDAFCAYGQTVDQALRAKGWATLLPMERIHQQSAQEFARWGEAVAQALGQPLAIDYRPRLPATTELQLLSRQDFAGGDDQPATILRFAWAPQSWTDRLRGRGLRHFAAGDLIGVLPPDSAVPRFYSLASGWQDGFVEICVRKMPGGLCSGYLHGLQPGARIQAFIRPNPAFAIESTRAPVMLIGAGTGVAPLAGFIRDNARGVPMHLYYGVRDPQLDYFFGTEIEQWLKEQRLASLRTTFSRVPEGGGYVQDALRRDADRLRQLIGDGAIVRVCGSRTMAQGVAQVLDGILGSISLSVQQLKARGRYAEDTF